MDDDVKELLLLAMVELRNGNADEALLILERTVYPKYEHCTVAQQEYDLR